MTNKPQNVDRIFKSFTEVAHRHAPQKLESVVAKAEDLSYEDQQELYTRLDDYVDNCAQQVDDDMTQSIADGLETAYRQEWDDNLNMTDADFGVNDDEDHIYISPTPGTSKYSEWLYSEDRLKNIFYLAQIVTIKKEEKASKLSRNLSSAFKALTSHDSFNLSLTVAATYASTKHGAKKT